MPNRQKALSSPSLTVDSKDERFSIYLYENGFDTVVPSIEKSLFAIVSVSYTDHATNFRAAATLVITLPAGCTNESYDRQNVTFRYVGQTNGFICFHTGDYSFL